MFHTTMVQPGLRWVRLLALRDRRGLKVNKVLKVHKAPKAHRVRKALRVSPARTVTRFFRMWMCQTLTM